MSEPVATVVAGAVQAKPAEKEAPKEPVAADETPAVEAEVKEAAPEVEKPEAEEKPATADDGLKKDLAEERKKRQTLERDLKALRDGSTTQTELLTRERDEVRNELTDAYRTIAAMKAGLDPAASKRLIGSTLEELEADAKDLAKTLGAVKARVTPNDGAGRSSGAAPVADMNASIRKMLGR